MSGHGSARSPWPKLGLCMGLKFKCVNNAMPTIVARSAG